MFEKKITNPKYEIIYYVNNPENINISVISCVEIESNVLLSIKGFKNTENLFFPSIKLDYVDNIVKHIKITAYNKFDVNRALKKVLPTVFDMKLIRALNTKFYLYTKRYEIINISAYILGPAVVNELRLVERLNDDRFRASKDSNTDDIIDENILLYD